MCIPLIDPRLPFFGVRAPDATAATASARIESRASDVFKFFIDPPDRLTPLIRTPRHYGSLMTDAPSRDDVLRARETIGSRVHRTPLFGNRTIGARLKCELFQRTGSFKARGALNKISSLSAEEKGRGVIAISAGNHAQAVAFAAAAEGIDALVVM